MFRSVCPRYASACCRGRAVRNGCRGSSGRRRRSSECSSGDPIDLERARSLGIVDGTSGALDLLEHACRFAREIEAVDLEGRRLCNRAVPGGAPDRAWLARERAAAKRKFPGVASVDAIIDCVEAACREPFGTALALSRRRFEECRRSEASRALRHLFFAERESKSEATPRSVRAVGVVGSGTMGAGIATNLATAGFDVTLVDSDEQALAAGMERVQGVLASQRRQGPPGCGHGRRGPRAHPRRRPASRRSPGRDLMIEAVFESLAVKREFSRSSGASVAPGAVLASNTSTLDIDAIAERLAAAGAMSSACISSAPPTSCAWSRSCAAATRVADVIATARSVARRMGKLGIVVGNCFGFVGNRMLYAYGRENQLLLLEGASPAQIDAALESFGMAMGPNAVGDLAGLDVGYRVRRERKDLARRSALLSGGRSVGRGRAARAESRRAAPICIRRAARQPRAPIRKSKR